MSGEYNNLSQFLINVHFQMLLLGTRKSLPQSDIPDLNHIFPYFSYYIGECLLCGILSLNARIIHETGPSNTEY